MEMVIFKIVEEHPREVGQEFAVHVVYGDESLPHLYENSRISSDQLTGQPVSAYLTSPAYQPSVNKL
ncbi:Transcription elongation factor spt6 [Asimina triloba]